MSVVLSIYSERAYKEFVLPHAQNLETTLSVRREVFGLPEDLDLMLENTDGQWRFQRGNAIAIFRDSALYEGQILENGDYFQCRIDGRVFLAVLVTISEQRFTGYEKYEPVSYEYLDI